MFITPKNSAKVSNLYYIDANQTELMRPYISPIAGHAACKYGQTTGRSCGIISQVNVFNNVRNGCPANLNFGSQCSATFVAMRSSSLKVASGDSGGAVYILGSDNKKYPAGVVGSGVSTSQGSTVIFSPLDHLQGMDIFLKIR